MYLAGQSHGNDLGESAADDVIVIENEERPGSTTESRQPTATSSSTRDLETHSMQQHPSAQRLRNDEDDDDEQEEEELPGDNFSATERRAQPRVMLIGWDSFRSRLMLFLIACLLIWACIFFPLLAT
ncbi:hypothetical protein ACS0PU_005744 [Formica fusca]